jgi:SAM-dependent methyltransferase
MMSNYIEINRCAYDATAEEFQHKKELRSAATLGLVNGFLDVIDQQIQAPAPYDILELGPGSGHASLLLSEKGHDVTAVEFSEPMAVLAQETAPRAKVINAEFMEHDFGNQTFDGILGIAFIHLFSAQDAQRVAQKVFRLLNPNGAVLLSTTKHDTVQEGFEVKTNFQSTEKRFRRRYTKHEMVQLIGRAGFELFEYTENEDAEVDDKLWMNFIVTKPS